MSKEKIRISRRQFVKGAITTSLVASGAVNLNAQENKQTYDTSSVLRGNEFFLNIESTPVNFSGTPAIATTINGRIPAPTLMWKEGEEITLHVTNHLKKDTSIHWHGILLPANMDGVPDISFDGIKAGETFTYKFTVKQNGTFWYHSHSAFQEQTGLYGAIVIEPKIPEPYECDSDHVIVLSDWSDEKPILFLEN